MENPSDQQNAINTSNNVSLKELVDPKFALSLQTIIFYETYWTILEYVILFCLFVFKGSYFFYPPNTQAPEIAALTIACLASYTRITIGSYSNKLENGQLLIWFVIQSIPLLLVDIFFITDQTYVLNLDVVIFSISIFWHGIGFILSVILAIKYLRKSNF